MLQLSYPNLTSTIMAVDFIYLRLVKKQHGAGVCLYGVKLHVLLW